MKDKSLDIQVQGHVLSPLSPHHYKRKPQLSSKSSVPSLRGFQPNLLANSLASKLKQQRYSLLAKNKENARKLQKKPVLISVLKNADKSGIDTYEDEADDVDNTQPDAGNVKLPLAAKRSDDNVAYRVNSASSGTYPRMSDPATYSASSSKRSSIGGFSRRSEAYGPTSTPSYMFSSESSVIGFDSRSADYTIKVIKRDGVFQPVDKYASGRQVTRENFLQRGVACEYETFMLPFNSTDPAVHGQTHFGNYVTGSDAARRRLKVSWGQPYDEDYVEAILLPDDSKTDQHITPPSTALNLAREASVDNFAFRRPVYSSGKSRVESIGLKWRVPSVAGDEGENLRPIVEQQQTSKNPMWSWLITPEPKHRQPKVTRKPPRANQSTSAPAAVLRTRNTSDVRLLHSRDIHPVSTAMEREGTTISKTKWQVPSSSTASTLDAERAVMSRLESVKRPSLQRLTHDSKKNTSNGAAHEYREALRAQLELEEDGTCADDIRDVHHKGGSEHFSVYSHSRRDDQSCSPTKSRSSFY